MAEEFLPVQTVIERLRGVTQRIHNLRTLLANGQDVLTDSDRDALNAVLSRALAEQAALEARLLELGG